MRPEIILPIIVVVIIAFVEFGLFKKKGFLDGKTEEEKMFFFQTLHKFYTTDRNFFDFQYWSLMMDYERNEFLEWEKNNIDN